MKTEKLPRETYCILSLGVKMIIEQKIIEGFPHRIGPPPPPLHMAPSGAGPGGDIAL